MAVIPKPKATLSEDVREIDASALYDDREWFYDTKGYFLIRILPEAKLIEVGHCRQNNEILKKFSGRNAKELCQAVLKAGIISRQDHAAYLGRETLKAETALRFGIPYVQDGDLDLRNSCSSGTGRIPKTAPKC